MGDYYEPFENTEEVWFWFCSCMAAKKDGWRVSGNYGGKERCCEVSDILRILKKMKSLHQISNRHLRIMMKWGEVLTPPYYDKRAKRSEIKLWIEGMRQLKPQLIAKGILKLK